MDLFGPIEDATQFADILTVLNLSDEDTDVVINMITPGGTISATNALIHAIRKTKAHVHIIATEAHSCGSLILLEAHSFELTEGFGALCHCGSVGYGGNYNEFKIGSEFIAKQMAKTLRAAYTGFFSEDEIDEMLKGVDIFLDADAWVTRHQARNDYFQNKNIAMLEEIQALENAKMELEEATEKPKTSRRKKTLTA